MNRHKNMTNVEFVQDLMEGYNPYGMMAQIVILDALEKGLKMWVDNKEEILAEHEEKERQNQEALDSARGKDEAVSIPIGIIHMPSFVGCAGVLLGKIQNRFKDEQQ